IVYVTVLPFPSSSTSSNLLPKQFSQKYNVSSIRCPHFKHLLNSILPLLADWINFSRLLSAPTRCFVSDNASLLHLAEDMYCTAGTSSPKVLCKSIFCIFNFSLSTFASKLFENLYHLTYACCSDRMTLRF